VHTVSFYDPFGSLMASTTTVANRFEFVGEYGVVSENAGLDNARAREYAPSIGRFITDDPIGIAGGLNLAACSLNNPISFIDPSGLKGGLCEFIHGWRLYFDGVGLSGDPDSLQNAENDMRQGMEKLHESAPEAAGDIGDLSPFTDMARKFPPELPGPGYAVGLLRELYEYYRCGCDADGGGNDPTGGEYPGPASGSALSQKSGTSLGVLYTAELFQ
jgi:RHS repeat-associated protein